MIRKMRRFKQEMSQEDTIEIFKNNSYGILALTGDDEYPYAVPLSYVYANGKIYFHSANQGHKIDAIKNSGKASFCVVERDEVVPEKLTTIYKSAIAFGRVRIIGDDDEKLAALEYLAQKYSPSNCEKNRKEIDASWKTVCVIGLEIEHITGKASMELIKANS